MVEKLGFGLGWDLDLGDIEYFGEHVSLCTVGLVSLLLSL